MLLNIASLRNRVVSLLNTHQTLQQSKQVQSIILTSSLSQDTIFLCNLFHLQCQNSHLALPFNTILHAPTTRLLNKMIATFSHLPQTTFLCYSSLRSNGVVPDKHTFPLLLKVFSSPNIFRQDPSMLFAQVIKFGFNLDQFVCNGLVSAFANSGFLESARKVFDESSSRDVVAWTALINGYVKNQCPREALECFMKMRSLGIGVDGVTVVAILRAASLAGNASFGKWVHGFYVVAGRVCLDAHVCSALVDMYFKCDLCGDACKVFDEYPYRNVVSWTVLIAGYVHCNRFKDAVRVFWDKVWDDIVPNEFTLTSVLSACAHIGALDHGKLVHQYIESSTKANLNSAIGTALVDMYAKCGCIDEALRIFEKLQVKNVFTWTAMINGMAVNGEASKALELFSHMLTSGIHPNEVTFIGVLAACSHGGFVEEGKKLFELMIKVYHLKPKMDHYGCMVDLLGRAGYLEDAKHIIDNMPMKPGPGVLGALFGACMIHKDYEMGEIMGKSLINLQPNHSGRYALLANLYSMCQNWEGAALMRKLMKGTKVEKTPGCSWIEVNGLIHEFKAFDHSHNESSHVYSMLDNLVLQLKLVRVCEDFSLLES
ncbi:hypothetical protein HN51_010356 [Arachis hypogaea]|uniref:Pentatricopeptide repeat-containing protein n=1 Tax=Arachis hypogaea TaxID=3818 RepID=A0A445E3C7_ARAHY|nr:pentatricopeptide repeat-containing protein At1g50270 [Arachis hypogaea]QHO55439.1 Pentatricopeptide repeat-containing protein [Arachis hypogaea]RYR69939.1 hypothetical protein Ahy_A03g016474 [Arachis hypogaea]